MKLYSYYRSSAAYRVRIALNLKGLSYELVTLDLTAGEHRGDAYLSRAPQGLVPALELDDGTMITQSMAIIEYLDQRFPSKTLLPDDLLHKTRLRSLAGVISHDIHPLNNLRVLKFLRGEMGISAEQLDTWYKHWITLGFDALEPQLKAPFCDGDAPGLVDLCLVPQVYNARRFKVDVSRWPDILQIEARCLDLSAFADARPEAQPDCPAELRAAER